MRYFYRDAQRQEIGPYTLEELRQLHLNGTVRMDTEVVEEGAGKVIPFRELWSRTRAAEPTQGTNPSADPAGARAASFAQRTTEELRALVPHLLMPLSELKDFRWVENRKLCFIAGIGLLPLIILALFADRGDIRSAYWAVAFYFSALWAMFFYYVFPAPEIKLSNCLICFFGTGAISISILLLAYRIAPLGSLAEMADSRSLASRLPGMVFGVGVPEELCKALVLFFLVRGGAAMPPHVMLFYGLMSGLGFGIYEGVDYQMGRNWKFSRGIGEYYLLNVIRLTTLPFLHAIWTGIAGYFIGFAYTYPQRKRGLLIVAIGVPALLHGLYNTFSSSFIGLLLALLSVLALNLYLAKTVEFDKALGGKAG
jgi:RsiW-degrading membrane proteinase PrsW (M82 family)